MVDDLDTPLGQFHLSRRPSAKMLSFRNPVLAGLVLSFAVAIFTWGRPLWLPSRADTQVAAVAGPTATISELLTSPVAAKPEAAAGGGSSKPTALEAAALEPAANAAVAASAGGVPRSSSENQNGVIVAHPNDAPPTGPLIIDVAKALGRQSLAPSANPRSVKASSYGPLPVASDGSHSAEVFARQAEPSTGAPRIALVIGGMGLSRQATDAATVSLPAAVTFGFAPYGADLARQVAQARAAGHEFLLQIPMEPLASSADDNPGPHTLLTGATKAENIDHLNWLMSRITGYAGVANFLGGKFTADEKALAPVLRAFAARGLYYLDDGSSARSLAVALAPSQKLAAARADVIIDASPEAESIERSLERLEAIARDKGSAIGVASALPATIDVLNRFVRSLETRGIALVPLSSIVTKPMQHLAGQ